MRQFLEHEHDMEETKGIPGRLPDDENILWQGAPNWRSLALEVFHFRLIALYFVAIAAWRLIGGLSAGAAKVEIIGSTIAALVMAAVTLAILSWIAWLNARATVYTITNKRVLMRIGVAVTITLNLPFAKISSAAVRTMNAKKDIGNLSIETVGDKRIGWLMLWPHVRPWKLSNAQPTFRCVENISEGAKVLASALEDYQSEKEPTRHSVRVMRDRISQDASSKGFGEMVPAE